MKALQACLCLELGAFQSLENGWNRWNFPHGGQRKRALSDVANRALIFYRLVNFISWSNSALPASWISSTLKCRSMLVGACLMSKK